MKKFTLLVLLLTAFVATSNAQFKFGVKGGLNLSEMSLDASALNSSNQTGFFIGPTVKFTIPVVGLSLDASAMYDQRSSKVSGEGIEATTLKQQSLVVPVNVRYGVGLSSLANVFFFAGPQFGFNIGDSSKSLGEAYNEALDWTLRSSNVSLNVGLGVTVLSHFQVSANYNIACGKTGEFEMPNLTNTTAIAGTAIENLLGSKSKNNSWQVAVAYFF